MDLKTYQDLMQPAIDADLRQRIVDPRLKVFSNLSELMRYQLGWTGVGSGPEAQGKRLRPLLVTLAADAVGGNWQDALPAASAVELIHNFSLIHDDIEDASLIRRGRSTVWSKWGMELAINAGDAMYAVAFDSLLSLVPQIGSESSLEAIRVLTGVCIQLTGGQHLDISYEEAQSLPIDSYWPMVTGKTASLLAGCLQLGAICGGAEPEMVSLVRRFGYALGLSFQIQDDWLGIWGDDSKTGKPKGSDLVHRKKTLPILYGLQNDDNFRKRWLTQSFEEDDLAGLARMLEDDGAREFTETEAQNYTKDAMTALEQTGLQSNGILAIRELATSLLNRQY